MYINKEEYEEWKNKVIKKFFNHKKCSKNILPKKLKVSCLKKNKVIIVLDIFRNENKKLFSNLAKGGKNMPNKHKIELYHSGNKKNGSVSVGATVFSNEKQFLHPSIDFGGLTNYRQSLGKSPKFLKGQAIKIGHVKPKNINSIVNKLYNTWKKHSKKKVFYGNVKMNLRKVILSIYKNKILNNGEYIHFRFHRLKRERAKIMRSELVIKETGHYYNRLFSGDDNKYAKDLKNKNMYCGVLKKYITTNLNKNNLLNEYTI